MAPPCVAVSKEIWDPCRWVVPMLGSLVARSPGILGLPCLGMISFRKENSSNMNTPPKKKHGWFVKGVDVFFVIFLGHVRLVGSVGVK